MRGNIPETLAQHGDRVAPPRRLCSASELFAVLGDEVEAHALPVHGAAWRDLRLVVLSFRGCGEARLPATASYSVLGAAGAIVVGNPGHALRLRWAEPHHATWVGIEPRVLCAAAAECGLGAAPPELRGDAAGTDAVCERLVGALAEEAKTPAYPLQELIIESIANALAYRLVTRFADGAVQAVGARGALKLRAFREVKAYIEQHIDERLSLGELARVAGVSRFHFARQFRLRTGESPMGFLLRTRIERGKSLLRESAASIGDVAAALGFADQSHFTRTFKRLVGVPPREYKGGACPARAVRHVAAHTILSADEAVAALRQ
jgi:AraC family transcriptional regulator